MLTKNYYVLGKVLLHYGELEEAVEVLEKFLALAPGFKLDVDMLNDARIQLCKAGRYVWNRSESQQRLSELQLLKSECESALREKQCEISQLKCLEEVFDKAMEAHIPAEVPHFLCCPITLDVLRDPVVTSSGITHERTALVKSIAKLQVAYDGDPVCAIVNEIYSELNVKHGDIAYLRDRAILTPLNEYVEVINREALKRLPGKSKIYTSCDTICKGSATSHATETLYPTEYLNSLKFSGMPNHQIELKIGAPIMLFRNLNPKKGLCNGTRLIVTQCYPFLIEAVIITGNKIGDTTYIPRINMTLADTTYPFVLKRKQFPVALCYAMTINKTQGQTMKNVGLYLPDPVFSHGQLYVAIFRVTSPRGLKIICANEDQTINGYTKNVVYQEIFGDITWLQNL